MQHIQKLLMLVMVAIVFSASAFALTATDKAVESICQIDTLQEDTGDFLTLDVLPDFTLTATIETIPDPGIYTDSKGTRLVRTNGVESHWQRLWGPPGNW